MLQCLPVAVGRNQFDGHGDSGLWCSYLDRRQHRPFGLVGYGVWACVADGTGWIRKGRSEVHRHGGDPLGLWGETDPEELLDWWLRIAANREEWRCNGRQHAEAVKSLSWRESMRKLLHLVEELGP